jgi:O-acetyl-ADP-ribose deacetylase
MKDLELARCHLHLVQGDITKQHADAIVNAANSGLRGGGGVDGAIHRAGGPSIMEECRRLGGCPTGEARLTGAGRLSAKYVIHAVGPVWSGGGRGEANLLASAYRYSLRLAEEHGAASLAFPSLSTGAYRYPLREAARIALSTVLDHCRQRPAAANLLDVTFVLFSEDTLRAYAEALSELARESGNGASS